MVTNIFYITSCCVTRCITRTGKFLPVSAFMYFLIENLKVLIFPQKCWIDILYNITFFILYYITFFVTLQLFGIASCTDGKSWHYSEKLVHLVTLDTVSLRGMSNILLKKQILAKLKTDQACYFYCLILQSNKILYSRCELSKKCMKCWFV